MSFSNTGRRPVIITSVDPIRSPFDQSQWALAVGVQDAETGETDDWVGEYSERYVSGGPNQGRSNREVTEEILNQCGGQMGPGANILERVATLVGRQTFVNVQEKDGYKNVKYIGDNAGMGGRNRQVVNPQEFLMGIGAQQPLSALGAPGTTVPVPPQQPLFPQGAPGTAVPAPPQQNAPSPAWQPPAQPGGAPPQQNAPSPAWQPPAQPGGAAQFSN